MTVQSDHGDMQPHEFAELLPLMSSSELTGLIESIGSNGLREPIVTHEDKILDGRNRFAACAKAGKEPDFVEYDGDDPLGYVIDKNLHRRHLSESQRAMVASKMISAKVGRPTKNSANLHNKKNAADLVNVSPRSVASATAVRDKGTPELVKAVEQDEIAVSLAAKIAEEDENTQRSILKSHNPQAEVKKLERAAKVADIAAKTKSAGPLPANQCFDIIYADPPWQNVVWSEETGHEKSPENHYNTMTLDDIKALPVQDVADDDAVLFLWTTANRAHRAMEVIDAWGFEYRTQIVWDKVNIGTGRWVRDRHELLYIAVRGKGLPAPAPGTQPESIILKKKGKHSAKPERFRELIDGYYPEVRKIELFARGTAPDGWEFWGDEAREPDDDSGVDDPLKTPPSLDRRTEPADTNKKSA